MPTKNLNKVQKQVAKKKGKATALHERSRDARRIRQASRRQDRLAVQASVRTASQKPYLERVLHFQEVMSGNRRDGLNESGFRRIVHDYVLRHEEDIRELESARRLGRPPSKHEVDQKQRLHQENVEYTAGLWVPDLRTSENVVRLCEWAGDWSGLSTIVFCRLPAKGLIQQAAFPPKGCN